MAFGSDRAPRLSASERERLERLRNATQLADLVDLTGVGTEHDAYFEAKGEWAKLRDSELPASTPTGDLPGDSVTVDGERFVVHGVTHADTDAERLFIRAHVSSFLEAGDSVYCEQGIRPMYFQDIGGVCEMDDYRWALAECEKRDIDSHLDGTVGFDSLVEDVTDAASQFRDAVFSLIHSDGDGYSDAFRRVLGDVASGFLMSHEDAAMGQDFESFARSKQAAENPRLLGGLQRYYKRMFLPQPLEREWLRRHDPELELVSHARNERMADYAVYHNEADTSHLIVGAAHQPGLVYYLERHRDGHRHVDDFELAE
ncbi:hypothetical protein [Natronomonas sp.]